MRSASAAVCALPLTKHTRDLVRYEHLALMLEDAVFVNVGRAEVVNREGVLRILRERPSFIFASDVWWGRNDFAKDAEFFALPNVVTTRQRGGVASHGHGGCQELNNLGHRRSAEKRGEEKRLYIE